jgi:hypothetical protein
LGGFLLSGRAWRIQILSFSPIYGVDIANNVLEFLAMLVTIWVTILECKQEGRQQACILAMEDNTSAIGWMHKSGKLKPGSIYHAPVQLIARQIARLVPLSTHCLASQHIKGDKNVVSNLLSFAGNVRGYNHPLALDIPSDLTLTQRFHKHLPQLIPEGFAISPLPNEISSFVTQALQMTELSLNQNKKNLTKKGTASGDAGYPSAPSPASALTPFSLAYPNQKKSSSSEPFLPFTASLCGTSQETFLASVRAPRAPWFLQLSAMRRFGVISNKAPFTVKGSSQLLPTVRSLLKAFDNADPPLRRQKTITPKFLRKFHQLLAGNAGSLQHPAYAQTADITLGAYFFAMRSCEYTKTKRPGRTKRVRLGCIIFRARDRSVIPHSHPDLLSSTAFVTIVFEDQKNGKKMDARNQGRSGHRFLCPVLRWGSAVQQIIATIPNYNDQTNLCSVFLKEEVLDISNSFVRKLLRHT